VGYETEYWLQRVTDPARQSAVLVEATTSKLSDYRAATIRAKQRRSSPSPGGSQNARGVAAVRAAA
jgi:hypothetical protein